MNKLRRSDRAIEVSRTEEIVVHGDYGILSTVGKDGQPYGVPLNYVYREDALYVHCARVGHKIDNIRQNANVSFCVVARAEILPAELSTDYQSVIIFGAATEIEGEEKYNALLWLLEKYSPNHIEEGKIAIAKQDRATIVIKVTIKNMAGKGRP